jgi:chaperone BCS1
MAKMNSSIKQPLGELPANVLETFIPGYSTIAWMVLESFSIDITTIVSITLLAFAFGRSVAYLRKHLLEILVRHGTCSIEILSDGDLYLWVMDWMADRGIGVHYPHLVAVSSNRNTSLYNSPSSYRSRHRTPSPKAKKEQRYDPAPNSTQYFWYEGRLFHWQRRLETPNYEDSRIQGRMSCVSWTTTPIKSLIDATKAAYNQKGSQKTAIRRPTPAKQRHLSMNIWKLVSMRPSRPLETVMLGSEQKDGIVSDIKEYLLPSSREWYAVRGIPYRRGYVGSSTP